MARQAKAMHSRIEKCTKTKSPPGGKPRDWPADSVGRHLRDCVDLFGNLGRR
jgi:hypothetical protein